MGAVLFPAKSSDQTERGGQAGMEESGTAQFCHAIVMPMPFEGSGLNKARWVVRVGSALPAQALSGCHVSTFQPP